ncbi:putative membrane protein [Aquimarina sp. MAR_2010_214]|uniref:DoxX family protein n=1 Tax=Aquimarina sp. MAR_2010_214 TaxID=1250026 RepID=UPI000C7106C6|nr:DoxX family membrane protein [Aquimarina sp. MAR_2010_214]PKV51363.1 putative membrane protein [Aquimarina sp. MAR_2010_214]
MNTDYKKTSVIQNILRILLGAFMFYAGIGHLTFLRTEFQSQVPTWITTDKGFMDFIVLASGVVEIIFGVLMIFGGRLKVITGIVLAIFYILIFPGNINQYVNQIDSFGLDNDNQRLIRLFFQPVLIIWALWSTGALKYLMRRKSKQ